DRRLRRHHVDHVRVADHARPRARHRGTPYGRPRRHGRQPAADRRRHARGADRHLNLRLHRHLPPVLHRRDFAFLVVALLAIRLGSQMVAVAVGWQVYAIHHSALDLGLIGLFEFLPLPILALPAGHLADRFSRLPLFSASLALVAADPDGLALLIPTGSQLPLPLPVL